MGCCVIGYQLFVNRRFQANNEQNSNVSEPGGKHGRLTNTIRTRSNLRLEAVESCGF